MKEVVSMKEEEEEGKAFGGYIGSAYMVSCFVSRFLYLVLER